VIRRRVFFNINAIPAAGSYFYPSPPFVVCGAAQGKSRICPVLSHNSAPLSSGESAQERGRFAAAASRRWHISQ